MSSWASDKSTEAVAAALVVVPIVVTTVVKEGLAVVIGKMVTSVG